MREQHHVFKIEQGDESRQYFWRHGRVSQVENTAVLPVFIVAKANSRISTWTDPVHILTSIPKDNTDVPEWSVRRHVFHHNIYQNKILNTDDFHHYHKPPLNFYYS